MLSKYLELRKDWIKKADGGGLSHIAKITIPFNIPQRLANHNASLFACKYFYINTNQLTCNISEEIHECAERLLVFYLLVWKCSYIQQTLTSCHFNTFQKFNIMIHCKQKTLF